MSASLRLYLAVIQPTPFCNIDCSYCYLPERSSVQRMSLDTFEHTARFLLEHPDRLDEHFTILWHGGEPTTMPIDFYAAAFTRLQAMTPAGVHVRNQFSTNATLLNHAWCDLIRSWQVAVRVSIDGPQWLHDAHRVTRGGRGTFDRVMRGIECLRANEIAFEVITVLSERSLDHAEDIWRFHRGIGASGILFCIEEILGAHRANSLAQRASEDRLRRFFRTLLALRDREAPGFYIRELDQLIDVFPRLRGPMMRQEALPMMIVSIGWDGGISTFSPELLVARHVTYDHFIFGNVATHTWADVLRSEKLRAVYADIREGIRRCEQSCEYFDVCGGGCPSAKLFETGTFTATETLSCRTRVKAIGDVVLAQLHERGVPVEARVGARPA